jgi:hypothetical protein
MQTRDLMFVALGGTCILFLGLFVLEWRWAAGRSRAAAQLLVEAEQRRTQAAQAHSEGCLGSVLALVLGAAVIAVLVITVYLLFEGPPAWLPGMPTPTPTQTPTTSLFGLLPPPSLRRDREMLCGHGSVTAAEGRCDRAPLAHDTGLLTISADGTVISCPF